MSTKAIFLGHLGLGDHIIQQAIINDLAQRYERVLIFCKHHNIPSVEHMCGQGIEIIPVACDRDVRRTYTTVVNSSEYDVFGVGIYNNEQKFRSSIASGSPFDKYFYQQLGMDFSLSHNVNFADGDRWQEVMELIPDESFCFVHDDMSRNFNIDMDRLNTPLPIVRPTIHAGTIFDYLPLLRKATEIHCMDSSFALMIDRASGIEGKKYIHRYVRHTSANPSYVNGWDIIH